MISFNAKTLDLWLADFGAFNYEFRRYCFQLFRVFGVHADFIPNAINEIHAGWCENCESWLSDETHETTVNLSHVKILALLLHNLVAVSFVGNLYAHEYQDESDYRFAGSEGGFKEAREDLIHGRETLMAFDFTIMCVDWFERNRTDRLTPFVQPLTADMRHDILNYLTSGQAEQKPLYLILKALYLRPSLGGSTN